MDERDIEAGELEVEAERREGIARAARAVASIGARACFGCGDPIPSGRRLAAPSANHCIDCQEAFETR
ncbi:MAG: TraR/DksA C4-type zinc finger protein [Paracoccaceae bacterium]